jgi:adenosine deaminase
VSQTRDLRALPKTHLHLHLEGSMRPNTLNELCQKYAIERPADTRGIRFDNFLGFNSLYWAATQCVRTRDDLARLVYEVAEDAVADGAWWIEPAFDTERYSDLRGDDEFRLFDGQEDGWRFMLDAAAIASRELGIGIGYISAIDRMQPLTSARVRMETTANLVRRREHLIDCRAPGFNGRHAGIVAIGLHSNEAGHPPEPFAEIFRETTRDTELLSTPHAGEIAPSLGQGPASVIGAVDALGADRVLHGVLAIEDPQLVERLAAEQVCLDVCPTSNILLSVFPSLAEHPLPMLLEAGVPCSIGSDDSLLFGPSLLDEYELCRAQMGLSDQQFAAIAKSSFQHSAAPGPLKQTGLAAVDEWLAGGK